MSLKEEFENESDEEIFKIILIELKNDDKYKRDNKESDLEYGTRVHIQLDKAIKEKLKCQ